MGSVRSWTSPSLLCEVKATPESGWLVTLLIFLCPTRANVGLLWYIKTMARKRKAELRAAKAAIRAQRNAELDEAASKGDWEAYREISQSHTDPKRARRRELRAARRARRASGEKPTLQKVRDPETGRSRQKPQETWEAGFEEGSLCLFMNLPAIYLGVKEPPAGTSAAWRRRVGIRVNILLNGQVRTVSVKRLRPVENDGEE